MSTTVYLTLDQGLSTPLPHFSLTTAQWQGGVGRGFSNLRCQRPKDAQGKHNYSKKQIRQISRTNEQTPTLGKNTGVVGDRVSMVVFYGLDLQNNKTTSIFLNPKPATVGGQIEGAPILAPLVTGGVTLASHLTSLSLSFLICKMGTTTRPPRRLM